MKIMIDIPEQMYKNALLDVYSGSPTLTKAIKNGTPLPKGHGDLIDRNELNKDLITNEWITDYDGGGLEEILFNAPAIIEADKEESEG